MKYLKILFSFIAAGFVGIGMAAAAPLKIIATTPDLADVTRQVGGEFVTVESLAKGTEDIHAVPQRPSFVPKLNQADAVVVLGFDAEHAFLPALLDVAQNPKIMRGQKGYIDCCERLQPLDVPVVISRAEGEQHPLGNPHYNIDPRNGSIDRGNDRERFVAIGFRACRGLRKKQAGVRRKIAGANRRLEKARRAAARRQGGVVSSVYALLRGFSRHRHDRHRRAETRHCADAQAFGRARRKNER